MYRRSYVTAHAHAAGGEAGAIRKRLGLSEASGSRHLVLHASLIKEPLAHDEGVVHGTAVDLTNTSGVDVLVSSFRASRVH